MATNSMGSVEAFDKAFKKFAKKHKMNEKEAEDIYIFDPMHPARRATTYDPWSLKKAIEYGKSYYKDKEE